MNHRWQKLPRKATLKGSRTFWVFNREKPDAKRLVRKYPNAANLATIHLFPREKMMSFKHGQYHQTILKHLINNTVVSLGQFPDIVA